MLNLFVTFSLSSLPYTALNENPILKMLWIEGQFWKIFKTQPSFHGAGRRVRRTKNDKRRMKNEERRRLSEEWRMKNEEGWAKNEEWRKKKAERRMKNEERRRMSEERRRMSEEWREWRRTNDTQQTRKPNMYLDIINSNCAKNAEV